MRRPPRDPRERLFSRSTLVLSFLQGLGVLVILVAIYGLALRRGQSEMEARALAFTTLIIANLCLILTNRSWSRTVVATARSRNPALWWVVGGALVFLGLVLYVPFLRELFLFARLHWDGLALCLGAGSISVLWFEVFKIIGRPRK
jgi:Ca2+-transporting ATPase